MQFSEQFAIRPAEEDDWFDPVLTIDTPLFLDPFLVYAQEAGHFVGSHRDIISVFDSAFRLVAASAGDARALPYQQAVSLLLSPELEEICLGYTAQGTKGSGSGLKLARDIAKAVWEAIQAGLTEITHFEEIA